MIGVWCSRTHIVASGGANLVANWCLSSNTKQKKVTSYKECLNILVNIFHIWILHVDLIHVHGAIFMPMAHTCYMHFSVPVIWIMYILHVHARQCNITHDIVGMIVEHMYVYMYMYMYVGGFKSTCM